MVQDPLLHSSEFTILTKQENILNFTMQRYSMTLVTLL